VCARYPLKFPFECCCWNAGACPFVVGVGVVESVAVVSFVGVVWEGVEGVETAPVLVLRRSSSAWNNSDFLSSVCRSNLMVCMDLSSDAPPSLSAYKGRFRESEAVLVKSEANEFSELSLPVPLWDSVWFVWFVWFPFTGVFVAWWGVMGVDCS
jgi:hypothetical protein